MSLCIRHLKPKCAKCGHPHKMKFCGVIFEYCFGMGHVEDRCKHQKDRKTLFTSNNYLEVLVDDDEVTFEHLNRLCGTKHDIFSEVRIPRRRLPVETHDVEVDNDKEVGHVDMLEKAP